MLNHLLTPYLHTDELRPGLCVPFANETHTFATDAVSFIRIPNHLIESPAAVTIPHTALHTLTGLCRQSDESDTTYHIDLPQLSELIQSIPLHNLYADCDQCGGFGIVECKCCGHEMDCKECDGTWTSNTVIGQSYSPAVIDILGIPFDANLINRLYSTAYVLEHPRIGYIPMKGKPGVGFFLLPQDVLVGILPLYAKHEKYRYKLEISQP